jgi:hypothetical protein
LLLLRAVDEGYINLKVDMTHDYLLRDTEVLYLSDRASTHARLWNDERKKVRGRVRVRVIDEYVSAVGDCAQREIIPTICKGTMSCVTAVARVVGNTVCARVYVGAGGAVGRGRALGAVGARVAIVFCEIAS